MYTFNSNISCLPFAMGSLVTLRVVVVLEDVFFLSNIHHTFLLFLQFVWVGLTTTHFHVLTLDT